MSSHIFSQNKFKVGDVVICHNGGRSNGKKGFVEEIVRDNLPNRMCFALYSIYGFENVKLHESDPENTGDYYFGDHLESELEWTGEVMTEEALREYRRKVGDGRIADNVAIVILNLGREQGRNKKI